VKETRVKHSKSLNISNLRLNSKVFRNKYR